MGLSSIALAEVPVQVFVSILPQKYFVERIGGALVSVSVMVPPGANPVTYEPKPKQMADLAQARIYYAIGVPFENVWLKRIAALNRRMLIVKTQEGIEKIPMRSNLLIKGQVQYLKRNPDIPRHKKDHDNDNYEEPKNGRGHHGILDPHVWLSPSLVMVQLRSILLSLLKEDPAHGSRYENNYHKFMMEILALDAELRRMFSDKKRNRFMVLHPAWGYFAQAYGLQQISIRPEGKDPKPAQLKHIIEYARDNDVKVFLAQAQFSSRSGQVIAGELGGEVVSVDPLAFDWNKNLKKVAEQIKSALW